MEGRPLSLFGGIIGHPPAIQIVRRILLSKYCIEGRINPRELAVEMADTALRDVRIPHPDKITVVVQEEGSPAITVVAMSSTAVVRENPATP
jgi:hypothetical protein